jgi:hypothetical protein
MGSPYRTNVDLAKELLVKGHPLVCELDGHLIDLQPRWHRFIMPPYLHPDVVARFLPLMTCRASIKHLGGCAEAHDSDEDADYQCECGILDCEYCDYDEAHDEAHAVFEVALSSFTLTAERINEELAADKGADGSDGQQEKPQNTVKFAFLRLEESVECYGGEVRVVA